MTQVTNDVMEAMPGFYGKQLESDTASTVSTDSVSTATQGSFEKSEKTSSSYTFTVDYIKSAILTIANAIADFVRSLFKSDTPTREVKELFVGMPKVSATPTDIMGEFINRRRKFSGQMSADELHAVVANIKEFVSPRQFRIYVEGVLGLKRREDPLTKLQDSLSNGTLRPLALQLLAFLKLAKPTVKMDVYQINKMHFGEGPVNFQAFTIGLPDEKDNVPYRINRPKCPRIANRGSRSYHNPSSGVQELLKKQSLMMQPSLSMQKCMGEMRVQYNGQFLPKKPY